MLFSGKSSTTKSPSSKRMSSAPRERFIILKGGHPYDLIPEELWLHVFPLLDLGALRTLRNVCSAFYMLTRDWTLELSLGEEPLKGLHNSVFEEIRILDELSSGSSGRVGRIWWCGGRRYAASDSRRTKPSAWDSSSTYQRSQHACNDEHDKIPYDATSLRRRTFWLRFRLWKLGLYLEFTSYSLSRPGNASSLLTSGMNTLSIHNQGTSSTSGQPSTSEAVPLPSSRSTMVLERSPVYALEVIGGHQDFQEHGVPETA
ncbi:hypothetical protein BJ742DRAFT_866843, partial [Cladochytrium replicatum]